MVFYYLVFLMIALCSFAQGRSASRLFVAGGLILILIAALRGEGLDRDYQGYIEYYNDILLSDFENVEPSFIFIVKFIDKFFGSYSYLFAAYALLGVTIKLYAINQLSAQKNLALLVYYCCFFFLLEMTQIRAGVAAGLLLLCIRPIQERNYRRFLLFAGLAFCFHYSAIIVFPLYFLGGGWRSLRVYAFLLPLALVLYGLNFNIFYIFEYIQVDLISLKIQNYERHAFQDASINIFNALYVSRCLMAYILFWRAEELARQSEYFVVLLKIYFIGIFVFLAFASVPGISSRTSELLFVVEIILMPALIYIVRERVFAQFVVIGMSLAFLSFFLFSAQLIGPYF